MIRKDDEIKLSLATRLPLPSNSGRSTRSPFSRWWIYQRERFPVFGHGLLIATFSFSAVAFSALLRGSIHSPSLAVILVSFAVTFLFFGQLRIADEFKDYEEDARYRPYRPVPRELISLAELRNAAALSLLIQLGLSLWLTPTLVWLLLLVWGYLTLMSQEFFRRDWLKAHPFIYMISHMLIMPLIALYATACDWYSAGSIPDSSLVWFLALSFFNGIVIELGRKIRAPQDEEAGVETYSFLWGRQKAVLAWLGGLGLAAISAGLAAQEISSVTLVIGMMGLWLTIATIVAIGFLRRPVTGHAKLIEIISGLWTIATYMSLGPIPLLINIV